MEESLSPGKPKKREAGCVANFILLIIKILMGLAAIAFIYMIYINLSPGAMDSGLGKDKDFAAGKKYLKKKMWDESAAAYKRFLDKNPTDEGQLYDTYLGLSDAYLYKARENRGIPRLHAPAINESWDWYLKAKELNPNSNRTKTQEAYVAMERG